MDNKEQNQENIRQKNKKKVIIITACLIGALAVCAALIALLESIGKGDGDGEYETLAPLPPSKLYDTYEEGFDIMEYDEYLAYDRNIYHNDPMYGVKQSVSPESAYVHGEAFEVLYNVILAINEGDHKRYNGYMGNKKLLMGEFTQQQIYDIVIEPYSSSNEGGYDEYIFKVNYRIHENNGTYRNTIESDRSRPQYFVIDNSSGKLLVTGIAETIYK